MKNNLWPRIIVLILMMIILGLSSFATYRVMTYENNLNNDNRQINNNDNTEVTQEKLLKIISNELFVLEKYNNLNQLTNQDKLDVAVKKLCGNIYYCLDKDNQYIDTFSSKQLVDAYNKTSLAKYNYVDESIKCPGYNYEHDTWTYNAKEQKYRYSEPGHSIDASVQVVFKKVVAYTNNNNQYTISIKYGWYKNTLSEGPEDLYAYTTYNDAKKNINSVYKIDAERVEELDYEIENEFSKFFEENYETYKEQMDTYNYVFEQKDDQLYLIGFSVD